MTQAPLDSPLFKLAGLPQSIRKRDGTLVAFDAAKIVNAMQRARAATGEFERAALEPARRARARRHRARCSPAACPTSSRSRTSSSRC